MKNVPQNLCTRAVNTSFFDKFLFLQKIDRFSCYKYLVINIENGLLKVGTLFLHFLIFNSTPIPLLGPVCLLSLRNYPPYTFIWPYTIINFPKIYPPIRLFSPIPLLGTLEYCQKCSGLEFLYERSAVIFF